MGILARFDASRNKLRESIVITRRELKIQILYDSKTLYDLGFTFFSPLTRASSSSSSRRFQVLSELRLCPGTLYMTLKAEL